MEESPIMMKPLPKVSREIIAKNHDNYDWSGKNMHLKGHIDSFISEEFKELMHFPRNISYFLYNSLSKTIESEGRCLDVQPKHFSKPLYFQNIMEGFMDLGLSQMHKENPDLFRYTGSYLENLKGDVFEAGVLLASITYLSIKNAYNNNSDILPSEN